MIVNTIVQSLFRILRRLIQQHGEGFSLSFRNEKILISKTQNLFLKTTKYKRKSKYTFENNKNTFENLQISMFRQIQL